MNEQVNDDKLLSQYLLGLLPEREAERLDELSITDDEVAARLQAVENDLVDAYARGELSGPTLERFNSYYLTSPRRREKVGFARGLQNVLDRYVATEQAEGRRAVVESSAIKNPVARKNLLRRFFSVPATALQWGLAAAVVVVLAASGWLLLENARLQSQVRQAQGEREEALRRERELQSQLQAQQSAESEKEQELESLRDRIARLEQGAPEHQGGKDQTAETASEPNVALFTLAPQTRGAAGIVDIPISADTDYVTMQLELEPSDFIIYRADLKAMPVGEVVWKSRKLRARARGDGKVVAVTVRAALLKLQRYQMEVYGISSGGTSEPISSYTFRVVK